MYIYTIGREGVCAGGDPTGTEQRQVLWNSTLAIPKNAENTGRPRVGAPLFTLHQPRSQTGTHRFSLNCKQTRKRSLPHHSTRTTPRNPGTHRKLKKHAPSYLTVSRGSTLLPVVHQQPNPWLGGPVSPRRRKRGVPRLPRCGRSTPAAAVPLGAARV